MLVNGWISIVGLGDSDCWFLWMSAGFGESYCQGCWSQWESDDLSFCLVGSAGGVYGACCDEPAGVCTDEVEITACLGEDQLFAPDVPCSSFDPPCGVIVGACCFDDATCSVLTELNCQTLSGDWLGAHTPCWLCPCLTPCPPEGTPEGEPICFDGYVDTFNGGCDAASVAFSPISVCQTVCGQGGVFLDGMEFVGDFDWYEITVDAAAQLTWAVEAEFPVGAWIVDGRAGCSGATVIAAEGAFECSPISLSVQVQPGTYWLVVAAIEADDLAQCGAHYVATATQVMLNPADMDGDHDVDHDDYALFFGCLTGPDGGLDPGCVAATFDADCDVDLRDFAGFTQAFTSR